MGIGIPEGSGQVRTVIWVQCKQSSFSPQISSQVGVRADPKQRHSKGMDSALDRVIKIYIHFIGHLLSSEKSRNC